MEERKKKSKLEDALAYDNFRSTLRKLLPAPSQQRMLYLSKTTQDATLDLAFDANYDLLKYIVGKEVAYLYNHVVTLKQKVDVNNRTTFELGYTDSCLPEDKDMYRQILRIAAFENGCIGLTSDTMIIPAENSGYRFYMSRLSGNMHATNHTAPLSGIPTYQSPMAAAPKFPDTLYLISACTNHVTHRVHDLDLNWADEEEGNEDTPFNRILTYDLYFMRMDEEFLDGRTELIFMDERARVIENIRQHVLNNRETIEAYPIRLGTALNPDFVAAYQDAVNNAIVESVEPDADGYKMFVPNEPGTRLFATWAEAVNFKYADATTTMIIKFL